MNHIFKLKKSSLTNSLVPVPEYASSHSAGKSKKPVISALQATIGKSLLGLGTLAFVATPLFAQDITFANGNTSFGTSANNTPTVNIANPNSAGVSHNKYNNFNISSQGLILNNSKSNVVTNLGGMVLGNPNLSNAASVILNEVVSTNRSQLKGYAEVAGTKADVVIVNPNGIYANGAGFINTNRATLSTGTPIFDGDTLKGFGIHQGEIDIVGDGINATDTKLLELLSRSVNIEGQINAQELSIVTGTNDYDYEAKTYEAKTVTGEAIVNSIDSSVLGGMYANRITLIATESGVGVKMLAEAASGIDDFIITANGTIEVKKLSAQNDLIINSNNLTLTDASLSAKNDIILNIAQGTTLDESSIIADNDLLVTTNSLTDTRASFDETQSSLYAQNLLDITAQTLNLTRSNIGSSKDANIAVSGLITATASQLYTQGDMTLDFGNTAIQNHNLNDLKLKSAAGLELYSLDYDIVNGSLQTTQTGDITLDSNLQIQMGSQLDIDAGANTLTNNADITAGTISLAGNSIINSGKLIGSDGISFSNSLSSFTNNGYIEGDIMNMGQTNTHTLDFINAQGAKFLANELIFSGDEFTNNGYIQVAKKTDITANRVFIEGDATEEARFIASTQNGDPSFIRAKDPLEGWGIPPVFSVKSAFIESKNTLTIDAAGLFKGTAEDSGSKFYVYGDTDNPADLIFNIGTEHNFEGEENKEYTLYSNNDIIFNKTGENPRLNTSNTNMEAKNSILINELSLFRPGNSSFKAKESIDININTYAAYSGQHGSFTTKDFILKGSDISAQGGNVYITDGGTFNYKITDLPSIYNTGYYVPFVSIKDPSAINIELLDNLDASIHYQGFEIRDSDVTWEFDAYGYTSTETITHRLWKLIMPGDSSALLKNFWGLYNIDVSDFKNETLMPSGMYENIDVDNMTIDVLNQTANNYFDFKKVKVEDTFTLNYPSNVMEGSVRFEDVAIQNIDMTSRVGSLRLSGNLHLGMTSGGNLEFKAKEIVNWAGIIPAIYTNSNMILDATEEFKVSGELYTTAHLLLKAPQISRIKLNGVVGSDASLTLLSNNLERPAITFPKNIIIGTYSAGDTGHEYTFGRSTYKYGHILGGSIESGESITFNYQDSGVVSGAYVTSNEDGRTNDGPHLSAPLITLNIPPERKFYARKIDVSDLTTNGGTLVVNDQVSFSPSNQDPIDIPSQIALDPLGTFSPLEALNITPGDTLDFGGGFNIVLPSNTNGSFVISQDPKSQYLIETNPIFITGEDIIGLDDLIDLLKGNPSLRVAEKVLDQNAIEPDDVVTKDTRRLGDSNYEAFLVKEQLTQQLGRSVLSGYNSFEDQIAGMMQGSVQEYETLGLTVGKPLTFEQMGALKQDIIWPELVTIDGEEVLMPRVYLSQNTLSNAFAGGLMADSIQGSGSLENRGTIASLGDDLDIELEGDITNTGGTISAKGDLSIQSTDGTITNEAVVSKRGRVGDGGTIQSGGNLNLDAAQDIKNIGSNITSGGDATLNAGNEIIIDTATETKKRSGWFGNSTTTTTNFESTVDIGGNLKTTSGSDTTIAGSDVNVGGDLDAQTGGNFNLISRQDTVEKSSFSLGGGPGIGISATNTDEFTGTNVASTLNVGGNANIESTQKVTIQGSNLDVANNANIDAQDGIEILDGLDEYRSETTSSGISMFSTSTGSQTDASSGSKASTQNQTAQANAEAGASAGASGDLNILQMQTTTTTIDRKESQASSVTVGGDLNMQTQGDITVQGSDVASGGNMNLDAKDINILAGRDEETITTTTNTATLGVFSEAGAQSGAQAEAGAGSRALASSAQAGADAGAEAGAEATIGARLQTTEQTDYSLTHRSSTLSSGADMNINAEDTATFQAADVSSGADMNINAENIDNLAAQDRQETTTSSTTTTMGVYTGASAQAGAQSQARAGGMGSQGGAGASAGVEATAGVRFGYEEENTVDGSITQQTNTFSSGGDFTRNAQNEIVDQGTQVEAGGDITQSARVIRDEAVSDETYSSSDAQSHEARIGTFAGAGAEAEADTRYGGSADKDASTSTGARASYEGEIGGTGERATTAVTSSFRAGGDISSTSEDETVLVGTQFEAGGDVDISAGSLEFKAAQDTTSGASTSHTISAEASMETSGAVGAEGEYEMADTNTRSSTARAGSITAGGNLNINVGEDATFEGTNLSAEEEANIDAGGDVNFEAARDTTRGTSTQFGVSVEVGVDGPESEGSVEASGGYRESESSTAQVGTIRGGSGVNISSGGDTTLEGTQLESDGDINIEAQGDVNLKEALSTTSEFGVDAEASASQSNANNDNDKMETTNQSSVGASVDYFNQETSTATDIQSGGNINISGENIRNQGANLESEGGSNLEGNVQNIDRSGGTTSLGIAGGSSSSSTSTAE